MVTPSLDADEHVEMANTRVRGERDVAAMERWWARLVPDLVSGGRFVVHDRVGPAQTGRKSLVIEHHGVAQHRVAERVLVRELVLRLVRTYGGAGVGKEGGHICRFTISKIFQN